MKTMASLATNDLTRPRPMTASAPPAAPGDFNLKVAETANSAIRTVTVKAWNCPGIFSQAVGSLTLNNFDIIGAKSYRQPGSTLDIFRIRNLNGDAFKPIRFQETEQTLSRAMAGAMSLKTALAARARRRPGPGGPPTQVAVDNESSMLYTIVSVSTPDAPGVLFQMTDAIFSAGFHIWMARVETRGDRAEDVFHVKDLKGEKGRSADQVLRLKRAVHAALG